MPEQDITWRPVGFREVFSLLDLDRYDEILIACFNGEYNRKGDEPVERGLVEILQQRPGCDRQPTAAKQAADGVPQPVTSKRSEAGKSLGIITIGSAKKKYL